jgi:hypothetical protein
MKLTSTRATTGRREHTTQIPARAVPPPVRPAETELVWPGMTRAELRAMVIEQIG